MDTIDTYADDSSEKHAQCLVLVDLGTAAWLWLWLCLFREGLKMFKNVDFERIWSPYDITSKNINRSQLPALGLTALPQQVLSEIQRANGVMEWKRIWNFVAWNTLRFPRKPVNRCAFGWYLLPSNHGFRLPMAQGCLAVNVHLWG